MPSGETGQLERGMVCGIFFANGRVIYTINTRSKSPKNKNKIKCIFDANWHQRSEHLFIDPAYAWV